MLRLAEEFTGTTGVVCLIGGWVAYDPESGTYLYRSRRRCRDGRRRPYAVVRGDGTYFSVSAATDREAVERAIRRLDCEGPADAAPPVVAAARAPVARSPICSCASAETGTTGLTQFVWDEACPEHRLGWVGIDDGGG
jgi:hypothetical protein